MAVGITRDVCPSAARAERLVLAEMMLRDGKDLESTARFSWENGDLRKHVEIYEEHIRMLTAENRRLREQIQEVTGVTRLEERRRHDT